ncbi:hypothetical protein ACFXKD_04860 [Nocardiopsis aegyptia]|uniref:hypothetical protein n=1 Tax=Nocardiopsis aegyptia TaxID=220378 RepID=UPI003672E1DA
MSKALLPAAPTLVLVMALGACAPQSDAAAPSASPSPTASESPSPSATPSPTPTDEAGLVAGNIELTCGLEAGVGVTRYTEWSVLWDADVNHCDAAHTGGRYTPLQLEAVETAGEEGDYDSVTTLYTICGTSLADRSVTTKPQAAELAGALVLCPDHPEHEEAEALIAAVEDLVLVNPGTHLVGEDIEPGTYYTESSDGPYTRCYWERTDSSGEIIDNYFTASAMRVEVTIHASDYSFHSDSCGSWTKL